MELLYEGNAGTGVFRLTKDEEVDIIIDIFATVALQEAWDTGQDLYRYRDRSVYLAGVEGGSIIGGIQLVLSAFGRPLPYLSVWPEICAPSDSKTGHVLLLALEQEQRARLGFFGLLSLALWRECMERGIEELWLEATPAKLKVYRRLGWPLCIRGELRNHWGEPCVLCSLNVAEAETGVRARPYWQEVVDLADHKIE